jgi:hypothetical protein
MYCIMGISTYLNCSVYGVRAMHNSVGRQAHTSGSRVRSQVKLLWICGDREALGQVPSRVRQFSLEIIILPIIIAHISLIYNRHYTVLATDAIVQ